MGEIMMRDYDEYKDFASVLLKMAGYNSVSEFVNKGADSPIVPVERNVPASKYSGSTSIATQNDEQTFGVVPKEAQNVIEEFDRRNSRHPDKSGSKYDEYVIPSNINSSHFEPTLEYALEQGTPYKIVGGKIYTWYKPYKGFHGSGFYRLKRVTFDFPHAIFVMDKYDKLPESYNY